MSTINRLAVRKTEAGVLTNTDPMVLEYAWKQDVCKVCACARSAVLLEIRQKEVRHGASDASGQIAAYVQGQQFEKADKVPRACYMSSAERDDSDCLRGLDVDRCLAKADGVLSVLMR